MPTVASLQVKLGADVQAAINGLSKAEFAADKVAEAFDKSSAKSIEFGFKLAGWATNFGTIAKGIQSQLDDINLDTLDSSGKEGIKTLQAIVSDGVRVTESITTASAAFSGMQSIAGVALTNIAKLIPSIGASLAALTGPIGITVGALAAGAALIITNFDLVNNTISQTDKITREANKTTEEQKAKVIELVDVLKNEVSTRKEQQDAIKKLNEISPTYFGGLSKEKTTVEQLNVAYQKYATNLDNIARLQAINNEISTLYQQQVKSQVALQDATAKVTQEQIKYNNATSSVREGTKNELPLILAKNTVEAEKQKLATIVEQIKKYKELGKAIPPTTKEPSEKTDKGDKGDNKKTDKDKLADLPNELTKQLNILQTQVKNDLVPISEVFEKEVDIWNNIIQKGLSIDPDSVEVQKLIDQYKLYFEKEKIEINVIPRINPPDPQSLNELPNRYNDILKKIGDPKPIKIFEADKIAAQQAALQKMLNEIASSINQVADVASRVGNVLFSFEDSRIEQQYQALDEYYEKKKVSIESEVGLESVKGKKMEQLDKEVSAKRKQIKREEAAANKRKAIFESLINTAKAVAESLPNIPLSVLAGALGAAQTAIIASTPLPALASGALVDGPTAVLVGEYAGAKANPEFISPVDKAQKYIKEAVEKAFEKVVSTSKSVDSVSSTYKEIQYKISISDNITSKMQDFVTQTSTVTSNIAKHLHTFEKSSNITQKDTSKESVIQSINIAESIKSLINNATSSVNNTNYSNVDTQKYIKETVFEKSSVDKILDVQLSSVISGDDILLINNRASYKKQRLG